MDVVIGETLVWSIAVTDDEAVPEGQRRDFKGFLFRLEGKDVDAAMAFVEDRGNPEVQVAFVCQEMVGGLTHTNSEEKSFVSGEFVLDDVSMGMALDVTVVIENSGGRSAYFYSNFTLNAVKAGDESMGGMIPGMGMGDMNMTKPMGNSTGMEDYDMEMDDMEQDIDVDGNATVVDGEEDIEVAIVKSGEDRDRALQQKVLSLVNNAMD